ncbi:MAG TPA: threonine synthase [Stellaceae bacterium]|nr:threonine synthase [Stellaceae bacterium]
MSRLGNSVRYLSTRDPGRPAATFSFEEVLLHGLAADGGLYVPQRLPQLDSAALHGLAGLAYADLAARIVGLFAGDAFSPEELQDLATAAYRGFRHPAVAPLVQLDERLWLLELFHGPTLAFKDLALQFLGRLFDAALARRGEPVTIVGATSGDTGAAALAACAGCAMVDIFILYPHGRISEVQRRQMTSLDGDNAHAIAIEGSFDDCQDLVKALFADRAFAAELHLSAINSINWARIAAQTVYYVAAGLALGAPARAVSFAVPTGNFGNAYAGHLARRMGLPVARLVVATNRNDALARYFTTGHMALAAALPSLSPSMDIGVASNFERLLFELKEGDGAAVAAALAELRETGTLPEDRAAARGAQRLFSAYRLDDEGTLASMARIHARTGILLDPHSAIAVAAAEAAQRRARAEADGALPMVALATAHPAKFPDAVERATGIRPALPPALGDLMARRERLVVLANDLGRVKSFIRARARRTRAAS